MKRILLIIVILHLSVTQLLADTNLYSGEVFVASQDESDRDAAVPEALLQVLQKLSGQREIHRSPALDAALGQASAIVRSYRYKRVDQIATDGTVMEELRLVAQFIQAEVDRIVQQMGLPRWRQERPAIQIWVVIDDGLSRSLKPVEFAYAWQSIEGLAAIRGLPVSWPDLDEEEMQLVDMRLVWGGFTDYLVERGAPEDGVAIIAARREGPQWVVRWNLASGSQAWSWQTSDLNLLVALTGGIHQMADEVAAVNTIAVSEQGSWEIDVSIGNLNGTDDYVNCLNYLQGLSLVNAVEVLGAYPGRVHFRLQINASKEHLAETFEQGAVLVRAGAGSDHDYELLR